jgi:hypothetical protein
LEFTKAAGKTVQSNDAAQAHDSEVSAAAGAKQAIVSAFGAVRICEMILKELLSFFS